MANDMARQDSSQRTSDAIHRNRLWWTIYMQERRLAAATGNPPGIPDDAITTPMPCKTSLFSSPDALITNINLARITGQITQDIYGRRHENDKDFIVKTQTILTSLLDIRKSMPVQFAVDLSDETRKFSRTGATLYLMLFQAIMFVTRPILLHKARAHVKGAVRAEDATGSDSDLLDRFCSVCVDAATNTLTTLRTVKAQGIIAKFGFFDLDAIFSAAFVFVLTAVSPVHASRRIVELRSAISLLEYLSSVGNKAAGNRLVDISQMCARLDIDLSPGTERDTAQQEAPPWEGIEVLLEGETGIHMSEVGNLDFTSSFWLDQSFALDGTVETDWEELERMATHDDEG
jgi:proline utilization trans-activator